MSQYQNMLMEGDLQMVKTDALSPEDKQEVQRSLSMYDRLWEDHPKVKQIKAKAKEDARAEARAESVRARAEAERTKAEAIAEAERLKEQYRKEIEAELQAEHHRREAERQEKLRALQGLRNAVIVFTKARFPELAELAQQKVAHIENTETLNLLIELVSTAPDEAAARWLLRPSVA